MEACGGAHYWARYFQSCDHQVKLIAPQYVKMYVKTNQNDYEEGIVVPQRIGKLRAYLPRVLEDADNGLHHLVRDLIHGLNEQLVALDKRSGDYDDQVQNMADNDDICRRLVTILGIGALTATALKAAVGDPDNFKSGRHLAAWLGLVPQQYSTAGRPRLLGISKRNDTMYEPC